MSYSEDARQLFNRLTVTHNQVMDWSDICDIGYCTLETINARPVDKPIYEVAKKIIERVDDTLSTYQEGLQSIVEDVLLASEGTISKLRQLGPAYLNMFNDMLRGWSELDENSVPPPFKPYTNMLQGVLCHLHRRCEAIIMDLMDTDIPELERNQSQQPKTICCREMQQVLLQAFAPRPIPDEGDIETARLSAAFRQVCVDYCDLLWNETIEDIAEGVEPWIAHIDGEVRLCSCALNKLKEDERRKQEALLKAKKGIKRAARSKRKASKRRQQEMSLERCRSFQEQRKQYAQGGKRKVPFIMGQSPLRLSTSVEDDS